MSRDLGPCQARLKKRGYSVCGYMADTIRKVQAAPGLWIHVPLCHMHHHIWDQGEEWDGPDIIKQDPCCSCKYHEDPELTQDVPRWLQKKMQV